MSDYRIVSAAFLAFMLPLVSCADIEETADAQVRVIDQRTGALTASSDIEWINGTYTTCVGRSGSWSLAVTGTPTMTNTALSVVKGDSTGTCTLTLTHVKPASGALIAANAAGVLPIAAGYTTPLQFGAGASMFYLNAKLNGTFAANFTIDLLFSNDPTTGSLNAASSYVSVTATAAATGVAVPDLASGQSGVAITTDAAKQVQSAAGTWTFTATSVPGTKYVVVASAVATDYASIDAAYLGGSQVVTSSPVSLATSTFLAVNDVLPTSRSIIFANEVSGVRSYRMYVITFTAPP